MTIRSEIALLGQSVEIGETVREVCPICSGGSNSEKSLAITRKDNGKLAYICHRASCGIKGGSQSNGIPKILTKNKAKTRKVFQGKTEPLSDIHRERILELWGIDNPEYWYWTPEYGGRVAMSVRSPKYKHRGWVLRDIRGRSRVKALTYIDEGQEGLSWYKTTPHAPTVVVEDIPSAVRASVYTNAVALLGTGIGITRAEEIAENSTGVIILALDNDATALSFDHALRYAALWGDVKILMLDKDLKDMNDETLQDTIGSL